MDSLKGQLQRLQIEEDHSREALKALHYAAKQQQKDIRAKRDIILKEFRTQYPTVYTIFGMAQRESFGPFGCFSTREAAEALIAKRGRSQSTRYYHIEYHVSEIKSSSVTRGMLQRMDEDVEYFYAE